MTAICNSMVHLCAVRVTRLDELGNPAGGPNNVYVTGTPTMISAKPAIQAGDDKTVVGGCDCIVAEYHGLDKFKRFDMELDLAQFEPGLIEMMVGAAAILDGAGNPIGWHWPSQISCSSPNQPNVCIEGWQTLWDGDHQNATYPYAHWIWPSSRWQISDLALQNDFSPPKLTGFTRGNPNWGLGLFGDLLEPCGANGDVFYTTTIPTGVCGYQTHSAT